MHSRGRGICWHSGLLPLIIICESWALQPSACFAQLWYTGVNLSGAEFGKLPRQATSAPTARDYTYPTDAEVDYFLSEGMNTFRVPFRWERLQPTPDAPFNSANFTG